MSSIFDGIIRDGIFAFYGDAFRVLATTGQTLSVGSGRAWFDHTWTLNDAQILIDVEQADPILNRIDSIVIDVDGRDTVRACTIITVKGALATNPVPPILIREASHKQYAIANIRVRANATNITTSDITYLVGRADTPYVTAPLEMLDADAQIAKWESQWQDWINAKQLDTDNWVANYKADLEAKAAEFEAYMENFQSTSEANYNQWVSDTTTAWNNWITAKQNEVDAWYAAKQSEFEDFESSHFSDFNDWFTNLQNQLNDNQASNLQNQIDKLTELEFRHYRELVTRDTTISPKTPEGVTTITETSDEANSTIVITSGPPATIVTTVVPATGNWDYTQTTTITKDDSTGEVDISEVYSRTPK
jgi:hypothetical protein